MTTRGMRGLTNRRARADKIAQHVEYEEVKPLLTGDQLAVFDPDEDEDQSKKGRQANNLLFWREAKTQNVRVSPSTGWFYTIFLLNPIALSWWLLLIVIAWVAAWVAIDMFTSYDIPVIDDTVPALIFSAVVFLSGFLLNGTLNRRGNNIRNFKSLISAVYNEMSAIAGSLDYTLINPDSVITLTAHNGSQFIRADTAVLLVVKEIYQILAAILAAQRNVLRGGFDAARLPLPAWHIAEVLHTQAHAAVADPLVTLQGMALHRIEKLRKEKIFVVQSAPMTSSFFKDMVDSLGNVAIDAAATAPPVFLVFYYFFLILWIIYMPFWLIPKYPGWWVLLAAPLSIVFFTATVELSRRLADIYVDAKDNTVTGYNLVGEMRAGAASLYATYRSIVDRTMQPDARSQTSQQMEQIENTPSVSAIGFR